MLKQELLEKAKLLPLTPGVYIMKNRNGKTIYVGKSKALKNRVSSYFSESQNHYGKTLKMVNSVYDFEIYHTKTELEALILENQFIKQFKPKYNIKLRDTARYPYIVVTSERYPKIDYCHRRTNDKHRYFGPFSSVKVARNIVETVQKTFKLPSCNRTFPRDIGKSRPCLNYHIKQCIAPCVANNITEKEYNDLVVEALHFLRGDYGFLIKKLNEKMTLASEQLFFEQAASYRDRIKSLKSIGDKQQIVASPKTEADIFGIYTDDLGSAIVVFFVRNGAIIDREVFFFGADEIMESDTLSAFLQHFYELREYVPKKIYLDFEISADDKKLICELLSESNGYKVSIIKPNRGDMRALTSRADDNAKQLLFQKRAEDEKHSDFLVSLAEFLQLEIVPDRIEAFDISNSGGEHTTCGMIVVEQGRFVKKKYRSFNIKSTKGQDDYGSLREALTRRFSHSSDQDGWEYPDLILMDGGVGQVSVAKEVLCEKGLDIMVYGMIKDEYHKTRTLTDGVGELSLNKRQDIFMFIYKIQEEVHTYSKKRMDIQRRKTVKTSSLTKIKGIGEAKAKLLLEHFGNYKALKNAGVEQITEVKGITKKLAQEIYNDFRR